MADGGEWLAICHLPSAIRFTPSNSRRPQNLHQHRLQSVDDELNADRAEEEGHDFREHGAAAVADEARERCGGEEDDVRDCADARAGAEESAALAASRVEIDEQHRR